MTMHSRCFSKGYLVSEVWLMWHMNGLVALALVSSSVHVSGNSSKQEDFETRGGVLMQREGFTFRAKIQNNSKTSNAISKQAHGQYIMHTKIKGSVMVHQEGLIVVLVKDKVKPVLCFSGGLCQPLTKILDMFSFEIILDQVIKTPSCPQ